MNPSLPWGSILTQITVLSLFWLWLFSSVVLVELGTQIRTQHQLLGWELPPCCLQLRFRMAQWFYGPKVPEGSRRSSKDSEPSVDEVYLNVRPVFLLYWHEKCWRQDLHPTENKHNTAPLLNIKPEAAIFRDC